MRLKLFIAGVLLVGSAAGNAQPLEEYPSIAVSASFTRDFHVKQLLAGASIAARLDDSTGVMPSIRPVPMLAAEWSAGMQSNAPKVTLMGIPVDSNHRLNASGDGGSNWGWWVLGGVAAAAVAAVAISAGGNGSSNNQSVPSNCTNSTGVPPVTVQNCTQ